MSTNTDLDDLQKQFNADKGAIVARGTALKFVASGDGTFLSVSVDFQGNSFTIGKATSVKRGTGSFLAKYVVVGLAGAYRLTIDENSARVYEATLETASEKGSDGVASELKVSEKTEQIWFWTAEQKPEAGIQGSVDVVFDSKVLTALAALLATLDT